jgi:adenylate kinase family enzyme
LPLVDYYGKQGRLRRLNGERPVDEVTAETLAIVEGAAAA